MRLRVRVTFKEPWSNLIPEVAKHCGLTVEEYCMRAALLITQEGLKEGERQVEPTSTDLAGDAVPSDAASSDTDSNALADSANT